MDRRRSASTPRQGSATMRSIAAMGLWTNTGFDFLWLYGNHVIPKWFKYFISVQAVLRGASLCPPLRKDSQLVSIHVSTSFFLRDPGAAWRRTPSSPCDCSRTLSRCVARFAARRGPRGHPGGVARRARTRPSPTRGLSAHPPLPPAQVLNANERILVDASNTEYSLQCVRPPAEPFNL